MSVTIFFLPDSHFLVCASEHRERQHSLGTLEACMHLGGGQTEPRLHAHCPSWKEPREVNEEDHTWEATEACPVPGKCSRHVHGRYPVMVGNWEQPASGEGTRGSPADPRRELGLHLIDVSLTDELREDGSSATEAARSLPASLGRECAAQGLRS